MVSQLCSLHLRCLWVLSFWVRVVFISSRRLGLSFPQVAPVPGYSIFSVFLYLLDLAISLTISRRGLRSSPSPGSSFSCQLLVPSRGAFPCAGCLLVAVHLSAFNFFNMFYFHFLGRDSGKFSRLPPQVFSFSSSLPLRPLRLASSSIPASPLCPGDTIACPLPYRLRNELVVMVWSTHSLIGRCSCGDSWVHLFVTFDDRCVLRIPSLAFSRLGCAMSLW